MSDITTPNNGESAPASRKKKEKTHWSEPFEQMIVQSVLQPLIRAILEEGVYSMNNLIDKFQARYGAAPTPERMNQWLTWINLGSLFAERPLIKLAPAVPQYAGQQFTSQPETPCAQADGDPSLEDLIRKPDPTHGWAPGVSPPPHAKRSDTANGPPRTVIPA